MHVLLTDAQNRVRERIDDYFERCSLLDLEPWGPDVRERLAEYVRRGKLLRGAFVSLGYSLFADGEIPRACIDAGLAMELVQSFLLIHDDIMDQDDVRRGGPSIHAQYRQSAPDGIGERNRLYGESLAICAGDVAALLAFDVLGQLEIDVTRRSEIVSLVAREITVVGLAQMQDVHHGYISDATDDAILQVYTYKTGRYTFSLPLTIGAMIAGASTVDQEHVGTLGESLGRIFQIRDDQLGIFGDTDTIGKPAGSDVREDKKTLYRRFLFDLGTSADRYRRMFGNSDITATDVESLRTFIHDSGVHERVEKVVESDMAHARETIAALSLRKRGREALTTLVEYNFTRRT